ncbi:MAG TPA: aminotransferase class I/II-fold pyridoxal phosphate-dependent enzyme [Streptosporangiaceae bacterium]|nr:aminotransferase class I/II-fold pyridoxal phosphate-dependent enzyme [Streptosporangiaceae bacterium]
MLIQYRPQGRNASEISRDVENAVREGRAAPGVTLPPVRELASELGLSPVTVAAAYRELREKGIARGNGRAGTRITGAPPIGPRPPLIAPPGARNLLVGSPDPGLLPKLPAVTPPLRLYGDPPILPRLGHLASEQFLADGIDPQHMAVVGGALDGVERVLQAWLRPGDRVAVEDPGYPPVTDLLTAMNLGAVPMAIDEFGVTPAALADALDRGCDAAVFTPRAQAPTGAAWDAGRATELAALLSARPDVLVIEDDHAGPVSGAASHSVAGESRRWATVRSISKSLGPDLRLAVLAGDEITGSRLEGRQALGTGWVSYLLQETVAALWDDRTVARLLARAAAAYAERRTALLDALAARGVPATGRSGLAVWVPVADEPAAVGALLERGWAVAPGERFRLASRPGIRIGTGTLTGEEALRLAADIAGSLARRPRRSD